VVAHHRRHHQLLLLVKAGQIAVLQNVSRVAVHAAVVNIEPHFMQHRRPFQLCRQLRAAELRVLRLPLIVNQGGGIQHAARLIAVDVVLACQALRGTAADVLMAETPLHLI